jgi:N-acyl-D-amino-acid deacylase
MKADIVIFDPVKVQDKADFANPHQYAEGVVDLIINGQRVIAGGQLTSARPGRVLRSSPSVQIK